MPDYTVSRLAAMDGWLCGLIGHGAYPRNDPTWIMLPLRKRFELYANVKPVKSYANVNSLHKPCGARCVRDREHDADGGCNRGSRHRGAGRDPERRTQYISPASAIAGSHSHFASEYST